MAKLRIFLDTNVWFSALHGSLNCSKIIEKHISRETVVIVSQRVVEELVKNTSLKIPRALPKLKELFEFKPPKIVKAPEEIDHAIMNNVNLKDQLIFQAAINSGALYFVTGNLKHFNRKELEKYYKIKILSPSEVLGKIYTSIPQ